MRRRERRAASRRPEPPPSPFVVERPPWQPRDSALALASALVPFTVYLATLSPTVNGGDSGELITVAHVMGVAHPPGFPLHSVLAKLFTLLPAGSVAWRVNLFSAVCDAAAAGLLFAAVRLWTGSAAAGVLGALSFAFSPLVWLYAIQAEVFGLNNLFTAVLALLSVRLALSAPTRETAVMAAFLLGLGLSNHHTLVLFGLPFLAYVLYRERPLTPRVLAPLALALALGFLPYLYLPFAASRGAPVIWGDTASLRGLIDHVLRREYGTFRLAHEATGAAGAFLPRFLLFWRAAAEGTLFVGLLLLVPAALSLRRKGPTRELVVLWLSAVTFYLVVFCSLANVRLDEPLHVFMQARFWPQPLVIVCVLMGVGLAEVTAGRGRVGTRLGWLLALGLPAAIAIVHLPALQRQGNRLVRDYGEAILRSVPPDSILMISSDEAIGSVRYLQSVESLQPETRVIPLGIVTTTWFRAFAARRWPDLVLPPDHPGARERGEAPFTFRELLDANRGRPVFVCNRVPWLQSLEEAYALWPAGLVERVRPKGDEPAVGALVAEAEASFARIDVAAAGSFPPGTWERGIADTYWKQYDRLGFSVAALLGRQRNDPAAVETAIRVFEALASGHPSPSPAVFKNLGVAYRELSRTRPDAAASMVRSWRRYLSMSPKGDPDLANIRQIVDEAERPGKPAVP
jgi:dolichyl-phosphate-mannose-protein mannosyltransferase